MQAYSNPKREQDPHALPDVEVFYLDADDAALWMDGEPEPGWFWQSCLPGCLPDSEPCGPFATREEALADAQSNES